MLHPKGYLITFEGGEGAGKSTQLERVAGWLQSMQRPLIVTRQPGGTEYGQRIRQLVLDHHPHETLSPRAELFLYLADRSHHVDTVLRPALAEGKIVLCDRYTDSTLAYQGYGRQLDLTELKTLNQLATQSLIPDLTLWLDIEPELGRSRARARHQLDRLESEALAFHQRVRAGYTALAAQAPERWLRLDATLDPDTIFYQIQTQLERFLC